MESIKRTIGKSLLKIIVCRNKFFQKIILSQTQYKMAPGMKKISFKKNNYINIYSNFAVERGTVEPNKRELPL